MGLLYVEAFYKFLKQYPKRHFSKGENIIQQDEMPHIAYVVKSGVVKTYNLTVTGEEKPIAFELKDAVFPISWVFSKTERTQYYYEALTDCELYLVSAEDYTQFLKDHPPALFDVVHGLINSNVEYQMRINALEQSKAKDKVLNTLQFLVSRYGKDVDESWAEIQLPFTQQDMANFMGLARETAAIELKKLERKNVISYQHRSYMIQRHKLKILLGENYDGGYNFEIFNVTKTTAKLVDRIRNAYGKTYK